MATGECMSGFGLRIRIVFILEDDCAVSLMFNGFGMAGSIYGISGKRTSWLEVNKFPCKFI